MAKLTPSEQREKALERERRKIANTRRHFKCPPECPSRDGYQKHKRNGEASCAGSRNAWRDYYKKLRARRAAGEGSPPIPRPKRKRVQ